MNRHLNQIFLGGNGVLTFILWRCEGRTIVSRACVGCPIGGPVPPLGPRNGSSDMVLFASNYRNEPVRFDFIWQSFGFVTGRQMLSHTGKWAGYYGTTLVGQKQQVVAIVFPQDKKSKYLIYENIWLGFLVKGLVPRSKQIGIFSRRCRRRNRGASCFPKWHSVTRIQTTLSNYRETILMKFQKQSTAIIRENPWKVFNVCQIP